MDFRHSLQFVSLQSPQIPASPLQQQQQQQQAAQPIIPQLSLTPTTPNISQSQQQNPQQPGAQMQHAKSINLLTFCLVGQETVQDIVTRFQEVFGILKTLQPPNGTGTVRPKRHPIVPLIQEMISYRAPTTAPTARPKYKNNFVRFVCCSNAYASSTTNVTTIPRAWSTHTLSP
jgi:Mediator complex subunit 30